MRRTLALALTITVAGSVATIAASTTPALAAPAGASFAATCNTAAKIRTGPHRSNTALGVCEPGDAVDVHSATNGDLVTCPSGVQSWIWDNITDLRTGVTGWMSGCYLS
jgi:hypothetical protein